MHLIKIILLLTVLLSAVLAMQECGQASNGANGNTLANANGNNNPMVENANASTGPAMNPPSTNPNGANSTLPPGGGNGGSTHPRADRRAAVRRHRIDRINHRYFNLTTATSNSPLSSRTSVWSKSLRVAW